MTDLCPTRAASGCLALTPGSGRVYWFSRQFSGGRSNHTVPRVVRITCPRTTVPSPDATCSASAPWASARWRWRRCWANRPWRRRGRRAHQQHHRPRPPPRPAHHRPRAKNVIYLFMAGGPSQLELFDYKPKLVELNGQPIPDSYHRRQALRLHGHVRSRTSPSCSARRGSSRGTARAARGSPSCFPHTAQIVDDITLVKTVATDVFNHAPAKLFMNTGSSQFGRPSMGAWVTYGIGSESQRPARLRRAAIRPARPARRRGQLGQRLPAHHLPGRAVPHQRRPDPQPRQPRRASPRSASATPIDAVRDLNLKRLDATGDPEIATRIAPTRWRTACRPARRS